MRGGAPWGVYSYPRTPISGGKGLTPYPRRGFREIPDSVTFRTFEGARAPATPGTLADRPGPFLTTQRRYLTPIVWSWDAARDP